MHSTVTKAFCDKSEAFKKYFILFCLKTRSLKYNVYKEQ